MVLASLARVELKANHLDKHNDIMAFNHMWLGEQRTNVSIKYHESGHMMYLYADELKKLYQDVNHFYLSGPK